MSLKIFCFRTPTRTEVSSHFMTALKAQTIVCKVLVFEVTSGLLPWNNHPSFGLIGSKESMALSDLSNFPVIVVHIWSNPCLGYHDEGQIYCWILNSLADVWQISVSENWLRNWRSRIRRLVVWELLVLANVFKAMSINPIRSTWRCLQSSLFRNVFWLPAPNMPLKWQHALLLTAQAQKV